MASLLELKNIEANYGPIAAIRGISLALEAQNITAILGANGAGKTTILRVISGIVRPTKGAVRFDGDSLDGVEPHRIAQKGISHVPEGREIFQDLTVYENLRLGAKASRERDAYQSRLAEVKAYFPILADRSKQLAGTLSGGEQQMLAIGRALMSKPRLLLLDEPSLGLSPLLVKVIFEIIRKINGQEGTAILLVEQNARLALSTAHYGYILEVGRIVLENSACELTKNEDVKEFYLGMKGQSVRGTKKRWKRKKMWR
jgi:branched-chain amino acid transport system ATP-binding protein